MLLVVLFDQKALSEQLFLIVVAPEVLLSWGQKRTWGGVPPAPATWRQGEACERLQTVCLSRTVPFCALSQAISFWSVLQQNHKIKQISVRHSATVGG